VTLNVRCAWRECVRIVILTLAFTTQNVNDAGIRIVKRARRITMNAKNALSIGNHTTVMRVVMYYAVIIVTGLRYAVFLTIHAICAKTDIIKIKQLACLVRTLAAVHVPTPHDVKPAKLDTGGNNAKYAAADVLTTRVTWHMARVCVRRDTGENSVTLHAVVDV